MTKPLRISKGSLDSHFVKVAKILNERVDVEGRINFSAQQEVSPFVAALHGAKCEWIQPTRGRKVPVAPLKCLGEKLWAWLRYREEWAHDIPVGGQRRFTFRSASTAVHFGFENLMYKPQVFRLEWAGWADWDGTGFGYQAEGTGHPHWQFDALESLTDTDAKKHLNTLRSEAMDDNDARKFTPEGITDDVGLRNLIFGQKLSRIHFASAAAWWKNPPCDDHAHNPKNPQELQAWLCKSLSYLSSELGRL